MGHQPIHARGVSNRRYDLDWLRFIAMWLLLFFHVGCLFNTWWWLIKNSELTDRLHYPMLWLHYWRMPLLLFISGAGTYLAMNKRTLPEYIVERIKRLLIPLIFGILVVGPPQAYYQRKDQYDSYWEFYIKNFDLNFDPMGTFGWYHLWFIAYLLTFSILASPLIIFIRSSRYEKFKESLENVLMKRLSILFIPGGILMLTQILLRPYFPDDTFRLWGDWSYFTLYLFFFLFGLFCFSSQRIWTFIGDNRRFLLVATFFGTLLYGIYRYLRKIYHFPWSDFADRIPYDVLTVLFTWFTILAIIGYGQHYLNRPHRFLPRINEGIYPFYIIHQTLIVVIGYYVCQLDWGITLKFCSVVFLTLISFAGIYFLFITPFKVTRFLFGMKHRKEDKPSPVDLRESFNSTL